MNPLSWLKGFWIVPRDPHLIAQSEAWAREHFTSHSLGSRVLAILAEQLGVEMSVLLPKTRFIEDLDCVDLEGVDIVMAVEEEFGFEIPEHDAESIHTVADLIDYVQKRYQNRC
jgi:acyl carrier protein